MKRHCLIHDLRHFAASKRQKLESEESNTSATLNTSTDDSLSDEMISIDELPTTVNGTAYISLQDIFDMAYVDDKDDLDEYIAQEKAKKHECWTLSDAELTYFNKLDRSIQKQILDVQAAFKTECKSDLPSKIKVLLYPMPITAKEKILQRIDIIQHLDPSTEQYNTQIKWINHVLSIPFGIYKPLLFKYDGDDKLARFNTYLQDTKNIMNSKLYSQAKIKEVLLDFITKKVRLNSLAHMASANKFLAFEGPPGVGKTTLIREGVAHALGLEFVFISLGGAADGSVLEGDREVWSGAQPGRIVDALISTRSMNPIFMFDELDKISGSVRGREVVNIISALIDPIQNKEFHDQYFQGITFDLSHAEYLFTFNDRSLIPRYLLDRLEIYKFEEYSKADKIIIAKKYMSPEIMANLHISSDQLQLSDEIYDRIIAAHAVEKGLRSVRKSLERVYEQSLRLLMTTSTSTLHVRWQDVRSIVETHESHNEQLSYYT